MSRAVAKVQLQRAVAKLLFRLRVALELATQRVHAAENQALVKYKTTALTALNNLQEEAKRNTELARREFYASLHNRDLAVTKAEAAKTLVFEQTTKDL